MELRLRLLCYSRREETFLTITHKILRNQFELYSVQALSYIKKITNIIKLLLSFASLKTLNFLHFRYIYEPRTVPEPYIYKHFFSSNGTGAVLK
jgi:hypothetical protein